MSLVGPFSRAALVVMLLGSAIVVGQEAAKPTPAKPAPDKSAVVNLNTASVAQLETLPGVGRRTAERIIEYREKNGGFKKIEELMNVPGVGEKSFLRIRTLLTVTPPKADGATWWAPREVEELRRAVLAHRADGGDGEQV